MKSIKKISSLILSLLLVFSLIGCNKTDESSKSNKNLEEIDLVLDWYPNAIHSFIYSGIEKGYYEEEGLKVNIRFPSNPTDPISLPASGKATVGMYYLQDLIMARANENIPVKSIGAVSQSSLNIILSLKEKNITSPKDLEGKTIGYSGTPLSESLVKSMIEINNGNASSVKMIDVGFDLMASMTTKNVDATIGAMVNHEVPVMKEQGLDVNYFSPSDFGVPNYYELVFVANDNTINSKPETLKKFLKASQKGFEYMKNNPDDALNILLSNQNKDNFPLTQSVEEQSLDILLPVMETSNAKFLSQDEKVWKENLDWLYSQKLITKKVELSDLFTNLN